MRTLYAKSGRELYIGREGEHNATRVVFDISDKIEKYGEGIAALVAQRANDSEPYPCSIEQDGNKVIWTVTNADTAQVGKGQCELRYYKEDTIAKSDIFKTVVIDALGSPDGEVPEAAQGYVDQVLKTGAAAQQAAKQAAEAASHYPFIKDGTWWVWDVEKEIDVDTGVKAEGKSTYEYVKGLGFAGTEEDFAKKLMDLILNADYVLIASANDEED